VYRQEHFAVGRSEREFCDVDANVDARDDGHVHCWAAAAQRRFVSEFVFSLLYFSVSFSALTLKWYGDGMVRKRYGTEMMQVTPLRRTLMSSP